MSLIFSRMKAPAQAAAPLLELSAVALARDIDTGGGTLPEGTRGTVVHTYRDGAAFEVEFDQPHHAVVTLVPSDLVA